MGRFIIHLHNQSFTPKDTKDLLLRARSLDDAVIRDTKISARYIEFDTTVEAAVLQQFLAKLASIAPVAMFTEVVERPLGKDEAIEHAKSLFNEERYWECHEVLEGVWKKSSGREKHFLQGIILTCAGFVHSQKDEDDVCLSVLGRSMEKLKAMDGNYHGIDAEKFMQAVSDILKTGRIQFFRI